MFITLNILKENIKESLNITFKKPHNVRFFVLSALNRKVY